MTTGKIEGRSTSLSAEEVSKALPQIRKPSDRKADDKNAPLNTSAIDVDQVAAKDPGNLGFGVRDTTKVDIKA